MTDLETFNFLNGELAEVEGLLTKLIAKRKSINDSSFIEELMLHQKSMPERLIRFLNAFKYNEDGYGACLIKGINVDDSQIGPTPTQILTGNKYASREEILLALIGSFLGDPIGWSSQRDGDLVNDIVPIKGSEHEQLSTGSVANLEWHVEEAFHPYRPDHLLLMCLRNPDRVETQVGSIGDIDLAPDMRKILFSDRYTFLPDKNFSGGRFSKGSKVSVLFGNPGNPYLRIDPAFMVTDPSDSEARDALQEIVSQINNSLRALVLEPGDCCILDNYRVVHGRVGFKPRFDGTDRWLKRINIVRDLRKSSDVRPSCHSRILLTD
ncbi:MAG: hypothetical protein DI539_09375 [Flavobacterium psychrophilum]|jgi:Fe(II)/alpha-ketoglutarate-dependent arginine beta-hydroxylase|nr:MAG: hypothetical protein DI539_09375 [Flavobacterium psychrophilum]